MSGVVSVTFFAISFASVSEDWRNPAMPDTSADLKSFVINSAPANAVLPEYSPVKTL